MIEQNEIRCKFTSEGKCCLYLTSHNCFVAGEIKLYSFDIALHNLSECQVIKQILSSDFIFV